MNFSKNYLLLALSLMVTFGCLLNVRAQTPCCGVTQIASIAVGSPQLVGPLAISPTGTCFAVGATGDGVQPFHLNSTCVPHLEVGEDLPFTPQNLTYTSDGSCLGVASGALSSGGGAIAVDSDCSLGTFTPYPVAFAPQAIAYSTQNCVGLVEEGLLQFSALSGCSPSTPASASSFPAVGPNYIQAAFSPNGSCFVAINNTVNTNNVCAIGVSSCAAVEGTANCASVSGTPTYLAFSPNGCFVVTSANGTLSTFQLTNTCGLELITSVDLGLEHPRSASFSPDGSCIAIAFQGTGTGATGGVNIYSVDSTCTISTLIQSLTYSYPVIGAGYTINGCLVVAVSQPGSDTIPSIFTYKPAALPVATLLPLTQTVCAGGTITLTAAPTGAGYTYVFQPPTGPAIDNGSNPVLTIPNATSANAGMYSVVVTLDGCSSLPADASVVVTPLPSATLLPVTQMVCVGGTITLTAAPTGAGYTYVFQPPTGPAIDNGSNPVLTIPNATSANAGMYSVVVTLNGCSSLPADASVLVTPLPSATLLPLTQMVCVGGTITLTAAPTGAGYTYVFQPPTGPAMDNGSNPVLTIPNATSANAGMYSVVVTLDGCSSLPADASVVVTPLPSATLLPVTQMVCVGGTITLTASPTGAGYTYVFQPPTGPAIDNGSNPVLTIPNATSANAGMYSVVVTLNGCSSLPADASVVVTPLPSATLLPVTQTVCVGQTITLTASPTGAGYTYVFQPPTGPAIDNGSNPVLTIPNATSANAGTYSVVVTLDGCSSLPASPVSVTVVPCNMTTLAIFECCSKRISSCDVIDYTISIKNTGPVAASNLQVVDLLPICLTFLSGSGTGWSFTSSGQTVTATFCNELQPGASVTLTIKAKAHCASGQKITNTVTATADNVLELQTTCCSTRVE